MAQTRKALRAITEHASTSRYRAQRYDALREWRLWMQVRLTGLLSIAIIAIATRASAIDVYIPAGACVVNGSGTLRQEHSSNLTTRGGKHVDLRFATNNSNGNTNGELAFCDVPYPPDLTDGSQVTLTYTIESSEPTNGLQHCVRAQLCVSASGDNFADCSNSLVNTRANFIHTTSAETLFGAYNRDTVGPASNAVDIFRTNGASTCTQAACANAWMRVMIWRDDSISGCSAPSSNVFAIRGIAIH